FVRGRPQPPWPRLRQLSLEGCGIGDLGLRALVNSPDHPALADLDLSHNEISDHGVRLLVASPLWPRLKRLVLGGNPISNEGAQGRARPARTRRLEYLTLRSPRIPPAGPLILLQKYPASTKLDLF